MLNVAAKAKFSVSTKHAGKAINQLQREQLGYQTDSDELKKIAKAFIKAKGHTLSHYDISVQYVLDKNAVYYNLKSLREQKLISGNISFDEVKKMIG